MLKVKLTLCARDYCGVARDSNVWLNIRLSMQAFRWSVNILIQPLRQIRGYLIWISFFLSAHQHYQLAA